MKNFTSLLLFSLLAFSLSSQNIPVNFEEEGNGAEWTWTVFENDTNPALEIVSNPDSSSYNTSSKVAKFTALVEGQPFAGCETMHGEDIGTFTIADSNAIIRILVWKSEISDVGIKLVRADNWSLGEIKIPNTVINQWEQLEFDFSSHMGNVYDQIVIFPDFNARSGDNVIYFDDIYGEKAVLSSTTELKAIDFTIFPNPASEELNLRADESITNYTIYSIAGAVVSKVETGEEITSIDISGLREGVYIFSSEINGRIIMKKFIKS
jgi:hypothetical protein